MLTLQTSAGAVPLNVDDYYIRQLASGYDELCFSINIYDPAFTLIQEESTILEQSDSLSSAYYLVKAIDGGSETASIKCQIDVDAWKASLTVDYKSASSSVGGIVRSVTPAGWAVSDESGLTYLRTIELTSATPLDVLDQCRSTFSGVTYRFDNINKLLTIVNMSSGQNLGAFVTRDLNLKENNYKGKSTGFATRLYAYGKDGMSFADINDGKPYVDDHTYSDRIICAFWRDERYTVKANLLAAAREKLAEMAIPKRSYECDVVDLAAINPAKYGELDFPLFSRVILIDQTRSEQQITHIVAERWIYPYLPQKNKVVLSTVAPRIQSQVAQIINGFSNPDSEFYQQISSSQQRAIDNATAQITGAKGGNMRSIYDSDGNWTELVVMNTNSITTASKLWRFNIGGFGYSPNGYNGPYTTAITMDGAIVADFITTGTLDASKASVTNLNASNITTGTLDASKITVSNLSASSITSGTLDASKITVDNLNATNITAGTLNVARINNGSLTGVKIAQNTITGGSTGNIALGTITGGVSGGGVALGNLGVGSVSYGNTGFTGTLDQVGINTSDIETLKNGYFAMINATTVSCSTLIADGYILTVGSDGIVRGSRN